MQDFDKLWNYADPASTELKFREYLAASAGKGISYELQLQTQIARTYSLRSMFNEAHEILNGVERQLAAEAELAHIRYHLERGRIFNSSGNRPDAKIQFKSARQIAEKLGEDAYAVDAIHMLAIISDPYESIKLNEEAIILAENSANENAKRWLGSLFNNLGWSYFDRTEYEKALSIFLRALQWREERNSPAEIFLAKWCVARTLRALNKIDEALTIQLALFEETVSLGKPDGYIHEELGELFLLKNDTLKCAFHFEKAYGFLKDDSYLQQHEIKRLERMSQLAGK